MEFIIFKPPKKPLKQRIVLELNRIKILESPKIKYLGVILDPFLRWNHHINELSKKLNRAIDIQNTSIYLVKINKFTLQIPVTKIILKYYLLMVKIK